MVMSDSPLEPSSQYTRRSFLGAGASSLAMLSLAPATAFARPTGEDHPHDPNRPNAAAALDILLKGNERFATGNSKQVGRTPADFLRVAANQTPLAAIIGCSDSRVAPELLFDVGIGELFVIRIAGNYVSYAGSAVKGSAEYAVLELGVPLIMVLGHSNCGAVKAAIQHIHDHDHLPEAIEDLVNNIRPAVLEGNKEPGNALENAVRANVRRSVQRLKTLDPIIAPKVKDGTVEVVGGVYNLEHGKVALL
jgi:carbonic anhydrase